MRGYFLTSLYEKYSSGKWKKLFEFKKDSFRMEPHLILKADRISMEVWKSQNYKNDLEYTSIALDFVYFCLLYISWSVYT